MAITRRTRNAFVGSSRHKGSNPFISVCGNPLRLLHVYIEAQHFQGSFILKKKHASYLVHAPKEVVKNMAVPVLLAGQPYKKTAPSPRIVSQADGSLVEKHQLPGDA